MIVKFDTPVSLEDRVLYVYLFGKLSEEGEVIDRLKEHKLLFLSQYLAMQDGGLLSKMRFIKEKKGPVAPHIYDMESDFSSNGFIRSYYQGGYPFIEMNESGMKIFDELEDLFEENAFFLSNVDTAIEKGRGKKSLDLVEEIYTLVVNGKRIEDHDLKEPINTLPRVVKWEWVIPEDWVYTVKCLLKPGTIKFLEDLQRDNQKGTVKPWAPL